MPESTFVPDPSNPLAQGAMSAYSHAMQTYALSQISSLDASQIYEISDRVSDGIPQFKGPDHPPIAAEAK